MKKRLTTLLALTLSLAMSVAQELHYNQPAQFFEEALVIGNGMTGATVYGGTDTDRLSLNDITLWTGEPCNMNIYSPDAHQSIPAIREALRKGDYKKADQLQKNVQGHFSQNYQPLGELQIAFADSGKVSNYRRSLDIGEAVAHTSYERNGYHYTTEYFATNPDSGIVVRITTDSPSGIHATLSLGCQLRNEISASGNTIVNDGYAGYASLPSYYQSDEKFAYDPSRGIHFRTKVMAKGDHVRSEDNKLVIDGSKVLTIYIVNATSFNGFDKDPAKEGKDYKSIADYRLNQLKGLSYEDLRARHVRDYKAIYDRVSLRLTADERTDDRPTDEVLREYVDENLFNPALEALYFQYGRYLLISCSRTPQVPANLQGLWNEHLLPPWSCN